MKRKQYSAREKLELLRLHLLERNTVTEICEKHRIHPTVFYRWQREFFSRGHRAFLRRSPSRLIANYRNKMKTLKSAARSSQKEIERLRRELERQNVFETGDGMTEARVANSRTQKSSPAAKTETPVSALAERNSAGCGDYGTGAQNPPTR